MLPEDGELLKEAVEADTFQPLELITVLHNLKDSVPECVSAYGTE